MNVTCPHCKGTLRIDRTHLPAGGLAQVNCPKCQGAFEIAAEDAVDPKVRAWLRNQLTALEARLRGEITGALGSVAAAPGGDESRRRTAGGRARPRAALICDADQAFAKLLGGTCRQLGFEPELASDVTAALRLLARHEYGLVAVAQNLPGDDKGGVRVLEWLSGRPGPERRRCFVVFSSTDVRSMDTGSAFIAGANLTLNRADTSKLRQILEKGLAERDELYRVFDEVTEAVAQGE